MTEEQKEIRRQRERDRRASKSPIKQSLVHLKDALTESKNVVKPRKADRDKARILVRQIAAKWGIVLDE